MRSADLVFLFACTRELNTPGGSGRGGKKKKGITHSSCPHFRLRRMGCSSSVSQSRTTGDVCTSQEKKGKKKKEEQADAVGRK